MSNGALMTIGGLVTVVVAIAIALLIYAAMLDGRDRRISTGEPAPTIDADPDPGWTFPPAEERDAVRNRREARRYLDAEPAG